MLKWYNWSFPAKFLPRWVKEERSRKSKAIIKLDKKIKLLESANCPQCSNGKTITQEEYEKLLILVAKIANVDRKYDDGSYHNHTRKITIEANDLGYIHPIVNMFFDDIKDKLDS